MKRRELMEKLGEQEDTLQPAALIHDPQRGVRGVAVVLGEDVSGQWYAGNLMILWEDGNVGSLGPNDEVDFWQPLFGVVEDENGDRPE